MNLPLVLGVLTTVFLLPSSHAIHQDLEKEIKSNYNETEKYELVEKAYTLFMPCVNHKRKIRELYHKTVRNIKLEVKPGPFALTLNDQSYFKIPAVLECTAEIEITDPNEDQFFEYNLIMTMDEKATTMDFHRVFEDGVPLQGTQPFVLEQTHRIRVILTNHNTKRGIDAMAIWYNNAAADPEEVTKICQNLIPHWKKSESEVWTVEKGTFYEEPAYLKLDPTTTIPIAGILSCKAKLEGSNKSQLKYFIREDINGDGIDGIDDYGMVYLTKQLMHDKNVFALEL